MRGDDDWCSLWRQSKHLRRFNFVDLLVLDPILKIHTKSTIAFLIFSSLWGMSFSQNFFLTRTLSPLYDINSKASWNFDEPVLSRLSWSGLILSTILSGLERPLSGNAKGLISFVEIDWAQAADAKPGRYFSLASVSKSNFWIWRPAEFNILCCKIERNNSTCAWISVFNPLSFLWSRTTLSRPFNLPNWGKRWLGLVVQTGHCQRRETNPVAIVRRGQLRFVLWNWSFQCRSQNCRIL